MFIVTEYAALMYEISLNFSLIFQVIHRVSSLPQNLQSVSRNSVGSVLNVKNVPSVGRLEERYL